MKDLSVILGGKFTSLDKINLDNVDVFENISLPNSVKLALELEASGTKVIVCTLGTYAKISKQVNIPVIPILTTLFDLLETVRDFEKSEQVTNQRIALILHDSRPIELEKIQPFSDNRLHLYAYKEDKDIKRLLLQIISDDINIVIGGSTSVYLANQLNLKTWLLYFGSETISVALEKGRSILQAIRDSLELTVRLGTVLNLLSYGIIITDNTGTITTCNPSGLKQLNMESDQLLDKKIYNVFKDEIWITSYINGRESRDLIRKYKKDRYFVSDYPIILPDNRIVGSVAAFQKAEEIEKLEQKYRKIKTSGLVAKKEFKDIIGKSDAIIKTIEEAHAYAKVDSTILIEGETGSGKEIFAQSIHNASNRRYGPFVALNCAALPETLLESELMGYEDGAFTGARRGGKTGLLELANQGTIFLDEINQISPSIQARLLRVIQEKQVLRLGGERMIPIDIRIIAATNEALEEKVRCNSFREDLYYRLNVLTLTIPSIRERKSDIVLLLNHFINYFSFTHGEIPKFSPANLEILVNYSWPGNVREIYNFVERYAVLIKNHSVTQLELVRRYVSKNKLEIGKQPSKQGILNVRLDNLDNMEKELIRQALKLYNDNKAYTSLMLGISRTTLWKKLGKAHIKD